MSLLQERVLVLNKSWQAVNTTSVRNAITLLYQGCAQVVEPESYSTFDFDSWKDAADFAKSATRVLVGYDWAMPLPEVIVLRHYNGRYQRRVKFSRRNIFLRDRNTCQYCAKRFRTQELTLDHVLPRSRGGKAAWDNIVLACQRCNRHKGNRTPRESGMRLVRLPQRPDWHQNPVPGIGAAIPTSWEAFLTNLYWNQELEE